MLQLLTLLCMEPPVTFTADKVRDEKVKVLHAITPPTPDEVSRWRCARSTRAGIVGGEEVPGYLEEEGVPHDSTTETYAALRLEVDNWRWAGVPIYLRTGKRLARKVTEIAVDAQAGAAPGASRQQRLASASSRTSSILTHAAQRGRVDLARREDPGHAACGSAR